MVNKSGFSQINRILQRLFFVGIWTLTMVAVLNSEVRTQIKGFFHMDSRQILSTLEGDILGTGVHAKVVKVSEKGQLYLEIFAPIGDSKTLSRISKISLANKKDGYFTFNGQATNLALDDINGDGLLEILAPSFDSNFIAHLHIFRYNNNTKQFDRVLK